MIQHNRFEHIVEKRYPTLYSKCNISVVGWDGSGSIDIDDILESFFPELKKICDELRIFYMDADGSPFSQGYTLIRIKILEWLRYNPDKIEWMLL